MVLNAPPPPNPSNKQDSKEILVIKGGGERHIISQLVSWWYGISYNGGGRTMPGFPLFLGCGTLRMMDG